MNIIHIGNVGIEANGVGRVIENLSQEQIKLGHNVLALTARVKKEPLPLFQEVHSIKDFTHIVDEFNPDIFIFHSLYIGEYIKFYPYLLEKKIPYLIQLHGALSRQNYKKNHLKKWLANTFFYNRFIRNAQSIIYLNKSEYDNSIVKEINPKNTIIPNGCPILKMSDIKRNANDRLEITYLGRIDFHHKGLDKLLEAIQILQKDSIKNDIHFSIYGNGEEEQIDKLKNDIKGLSPLVDFYGAVYGDKKIMAFRKSDIFILTSRYEGMPMGVLEALSYQIPCILTPETNMEDIIREYKCGWITEFESSKIAFTIKKAAKEYRKEKEELRGNSYNASKEFMWDKIAEMSINQYSKIINNA